MIARGILDVNIGLLRAICHFFHCLRLYTRAGMRTSLLSCCLVDPCSIPKGVLFLETITWKLVILTHAVHGQFEITSTAVTTLWLHLLEVYSQEHVIKVTKTH